MKTIKIIFASLLVLIFTNELVAQDECPSFKMGKKSIKLKFIPKMKKAKAVIKFTPTLILGVGKPFIQEETQTKQNGQTSTQIDKTTGNPNMNSYTGYIFPFSYETAIRKKSTLEFSLAYEMLWRQSFPDTLRYEYPTVDMTQYMDSMKQGAEINSYDGVISNNIKVGVSYRYYFFKKAYSGLYVGPQTGFSFGRNEYIDQDTNPDNINYGFIQNNLVFNMGLSTGYQFVIKKHFVIDANIGMLFKEGINFSKKYNDKDATDEGLAMKYPNTESLHQHYKLGFNMGMGVGYKF